MIYVFLSGKATCPRRITLHIGVDKVHLGECLDNVPEKILLKAVISSNVQFFQVVILFPNIVPERRVPA